MTTSGVICLQGGRELTPPCVEMDTAVVAAARRVRGRRPGRASGEHSGDQSGHQSGDRAVVAVLAGAARIGADYAGAAGRTRRHYAALEAHLAIRIDVRTVPDPRVDERAALAALDESIDLLVLPGGSPTSLHGILEGDVGRRIVELWRSETMSISGASAGAMVLCTSTRRPDRRPTDTVRGLGLVEGVALVHWSPTLSPPEPRTTTFWGLPECGGVLIAPADDADNGRTVVAVGQGNAALSRNGAWERLPRITPPA